MLWRGKNLAAVLLFQITSAPKYISAIDTNAPAQLARPYGVPEVYKLFFG
jgi:hypothetical protein